MSIRKLNPEDLDGKWVDTHVHTVGTDLTHFIFNKYPTAHSIVDMKNKAKRAGVDYFVSLTMPSTIYYDYHHYWSTGQLKSSGYGKFPFEYENRYMLQCILSMNITNALPFLSFSLQDKISEQENNLIKLIDSYNVYGLKYHTIADQKKALSIMSDSNILSIAEKYNIPLLIHAGIDELSDPCNIYMLAKQNPTIRFCVAHVGDFSSSFIDMALALPLKNLFIDSGPLMAKCMRISADESMKIGRIDIDYSNPYRVFNEIYAIFPNSLLWSSDEPWTMYGKLGDDMSIFGVEYEKEATLYSTCEFKNALSQNVKRYLFG